MAQYDCMAVCAVKCANCCRWPVVMSTACRLPVHCFPIKLSPSRPVTPLVSACHSLISTPTPGRHNTTHYRLHLTSSSHLLISNILFQELRLDGNILKRVPTESLRGPTSLQNLHLQDNIIGRTGLAVPVNDQAGCQALPASAEIGKLS